MTEALKRDYNILEEIGRGRFGVVSKCYSIETGEVYAVKTIDKRLVVDDPVDRQCIDNEAKIMQKLKPNPHVVQVFDVYEDESCQHIVLELCNAPDLFQRISTRPIFTETEAVSIMVPLMEAIAHCHRRGVAHRDIKPENILFNDWGELKLADFGSADCLRDGELMSGLVGTPYYVAPEVVAGRDYTEKVDVWSAGVILYIILAGIPPFYGDSAPEIFAAVLRGNLRFPARLFHSVSTEAKDLLRRMICKDISRRFSAEQVLRTGRSYLVKYLATKERLDPGRADPSKGILAVELGGQHLLGTFPKLLSTSTPKQRLIQRRGPDWGMRRGI